MHSLALACALLGHQAGQRAHVPAARKAVRSALNLALSNLARKRSAARSSGVRKASSQAKEAAKAVSSARKALDAAPGLLSQVAQSEDGAIDQLELRALLTQCLEAYRLLPRNSRSVAHCSQP